MPADRAPAPTTAAGRLATLTLIAASCGDPAPPACDQALFGVPGPSTGLSAAQCGPRCACDGDPAWLAPTYTAEDVAALRRWTQLDPPAPLVDDPYDRPAPPVPDGAVCGVVQDDVVLRRYHLVSYGSRAEALAAGALPTHGGVCGVCSSLADLAVYIERPDLTAPVRACGLMYPSGPQADHLACLGQLGFTAPCAQIWYFNTVHTRTMCLAPCLRLLDAPYHTPDGALNECLQCDEVQSGPVFKAIAGRTRRNTGVPSALCRPCSEVDRLVHRY